MLVVRDNVNNFFPDLFARKRNADRPKFDFAREGVPIAKCIGMRAGKGAVHSFVLE